MNLPQRFYRADGYETERSIADAERAFARRIVVGIIVFGLMLVFAVIRIGGAA